MGRWTAKKLTALEIPNLVYKLPFRWRCARCLLQRSETNGGPAGGPHNLISSEVLYRFLSKFGTTFHWNTGVGKWCCLIKKQDAFFKDQGPIGAPLGAPIILYLRKFFTDCFQNLAKRFIGIQMYVNDIVFKKNNIIKLLLYSNEALCQILKATSKEFS